MDVSKPHLFPIAIGPSDIDFMGHVNNSRYLAWVQDAVVDHWKKLAPPDAVARHLWVALKHEITYRRPAFLGDDVVAHVVLVKVQGVRATYETLVRRGEVIIAEVRSTWCSIDAETRRPARLASDVIERFVSRG